MRQTVGHASLPTAMDSPVLARSRQLFACVSAADGETLPSASMLADRIEQWFWHAATPPENLTEAALSDAFSVGRRLARQASRLLQQRYVMMPKRGGGGSGGLKRIVPPLTLVAATLAETVRADADKRAIAEAEAALAPMLETTSPELASLVRTTLECLYNAPSPERLGGRSVGQAGGLADRLLAEIADMRGDTRKAGDHTYFLGSLDAISLRHGSSLEIAVEAVRLLEDRQLAHLRRGRGGGVFATTGSPLEAMRITNAWLAGCGVPVETCHNLLQAINVAMIRMACQRGSAAGIERMHAAMGAMASTREATDIGIAWYPLQREIAVLARNPVLHLFAQVLAGSLLARRLHAADLPEGAARELFEASRLITKNIALGKMGDSSRAHQRCQLVLSQYW